MAQVVAIAYATMTILILTTVIIRSFSHIQLSFYKFFTIISHCWKWLPMYYDRTTAQAATYS